MRTVFLWVIMQWVVVIPYRRFGTINWSHPQGSRNKKRLLKMGMIGCPETSVRNCHYLLRNYPEQCSSQFDHRISGIYLNIWKNKLCAKFKSINTLMPPVVKNAKCTTSYDIIPTLFARCLVGLLRCELWRIWVPTDVVKCRLRLSRVLLSFSAYLKTVVCSYWRIPVPVL